MCGKMPQIIATYLCENREAFAELFCKEIIFQDACSTKIKSFVYEKVKTYVPS